MGNRGQVKSRSEAPHAMHGLGDGMSFGGVYDGMSQGQLDGLSREMAGADFSKEDRPAGDHAIHSSGKICAKCGDEIASFQDIRRRGTEEWVHDVCPVL